MRRKADPHFGKICQFFDTKERRCGIYLARPSTCRIFPGEGRCGYYDFLSFERAGQEDETYISTTDHAGQLSQPYLHWPSSRRRPGSRFATAFE